MPLDKRHTTNASRVMLPTYLLLNAAFAVAFLADWQNRLNLTPSLDYARGLLTITQWGMIWLGLAIIMAVALAAGHRAGFITALAINVAAWLLWGIAVEAAVTSQPNVSPLAGALPWFVAVASFASMVSLLSREA